MIYIKDYEAPDMFNPFPFLGPKRKQRIEESWAKVFRKQIPATLPVEKIFSKYDPVFGAPTKELFPPSSWMSIRIISKNRPGFSASPVSP